jgi:PAS domain S-box-containing protein
MTGQHSERSNRELTVEGKRRRHHGAEAEEGELQQYIARLRQQPLLGRAHFLVRDTEDRICFWSKGAALIYGFTEAEALGNPSTALLHTIFPTARETIEAELHSKGQWEGELIHRRKDGTTVVVASHWALHSNTRGRPVAVLEVDNDITELKQLQEALRQADRRKDEFLAMLAHELRNPLAPILNALHIMRLARGNPDTIEESRCLIERQVKHMVRIIDDLLDLSRIARGKIQLRMQPVELGQVVRAAVESSRPMIDSAGHHLTILLPPEPIFFEADATRLSQVLLNLLNNAAKYTERGGRIWVAARKDDDDLVISVRDSGVGIPSEMLPTIFEMFAQADRSLNRSQGGLGIGLALVRGLVRLHGGTVSARSEGAGRGSEFIVRLPLRRANIAPSPSPDAAGAHVAHMAKTPRRVLVVDDDVDGARSLEKLLKMLGHQVVITHDGSAGLSAARRFKPDLIILDIGLPGINGYEIASFLRKTPELRHVPLVAMTGWGKEEDRRRSKEAGFKTHLVKPVELCDLEAILADPGMRSGYEESSVSRCEVQV